MEMGVAMGVLSRFPAWASTSDREAIQGRLSFKDGVVALAATVAVAVAAANICARSLLAACVR